MTDEAALEQFERTVLAQAPPKSWEPVTDYGLEARIKAEGKNPDLIVEVFQPVVALDAGCGPGHLVRMLAERGVKVYGFDARGYREWLGGTVFKLGLLDNVNGRSSLPHWGESKHEQYDLVICREVLEHLRAVQIPRAVRNLCALSSRFVYVTTRFAKDPQHLLSVDTSDDLDPTHITMLNQTLLRALFVLEGFTRRADLEERLDWMQKGRCLVYERA